MSRPGYLPSLSVLGPGALEQAFDANVVHVDDDLVALGEIVPDPERPLPHGTPVHSLLIHLGEDGPELVELNDQHNTVGVAALCRTELARDQLRLAFLPGQGPVPGRVSLAPEIEVFDDDAERDDAPPLAAVRVRFTCDDAIFEQLREKLAPLL